MLLYKYPTLTDGRNNKVCPGAVVCYININEISMGYFVVNEYIYYLGA
jgi:hypothetical protein